MLKTIWLSANKFGYELLKEVIKIQGIQITTIITLSSDANTKMYDGIDQQKWYDLGIPVIEVENINDNIKLIKEIDPDIIFACGWRQIITKEILEIPSEGIIGFHPTLLPFGRGPAPIINSILLDVKKSGLSMFFLANGTDDGDIIGQEHFDIDNSDHASDLYEKIIVAGKELIRKYGTSIAKREVQRIPQISENAFYFPKRTLKDNEIKMDVESPVEIVRKIRAFSNPYNGAYIRKGNKKIILWEAELLEDEYA